MPERKSEDLQETIRKIAAAKLRGDEDLREELVRQFKKRTQYHERASAYRATVAFYPIADEFGLATEMVESALDQLDELAEADGPLRDLFLRADLAHTLMCAVLDEIDELTAAAGEAMGLTLD